MYKRGVLIFFYWWFFHGLTGWERKRKTKRLPAWKRGALGPGMITYLHIRTNPKEEEKERGRERELRNKIHHSFISDRQSLMCVFRHPTHPHGWAKKDKRREREERSVRSRGISQEDNGKWKGERRSVRENKQKKKTKRKKQQQISRGYLWLVAFLQGVGFAPLCWDRRFCVWIVCRVVLSINPI